MKILQINTLFAPHRYGGAEVFLERLSERLVDEGHEVVVACLSPAPATQPPAPVRVEQFGLRNVFWPYDGVPRPRWLKAIWHLRNSFGQGSAPRRRGVIAAGASRRGPHPQFGRLHVLGLGHDSRRPGFRWSTRYTITLCCVRAR